MPLDPGPATGAGSPVRFEVPSSRRMTAERSVRPSDVAVPVGFEPTGQCECLDGV